MNLNTITVDRSFARQQFLDYRHAIQRRHNARHVGSRTGRLQGWSL